MVLDVIKGYLQVAEGLSDVALQRVKELAEALTTQGMEATAKSTEQMQSLSDEVMEAGRTNVDMLTGLVRTEVDRAVARMGFVREEELAAVRGHVQRLEEQLRKEHQRATDRATGAVMTAADVAQTAAKTGVDVASEAASTVTGAARTVIERATATDSKPPAAEATVAPVQRAPAAKKTAAKKTAAKKTAAKKAPAKKTATKRTGAAE